VENLLQLLLLVAYLAIALISIVMAIYAIAVSFLGRETFRSVLRMQKRREELKRRIKELTEKLDEETSVERIREEIRNSEGEESELKNRLRWLSVRGAVFFPCVFFSASLMIAAYDIYFYNVNPSEYSAALILPMVFFLALGFSGLGKTLIAIQEAALRIPLPKFEVSFPSRLSIEEGKSKEKRNVSFVLSNIGEDIAEDVEVFINFPPKFTVHENARYLVFKQGPETYYPSHIAAIYKTSLLNIDRHQHYPVLVTFPEETGSIAIPIVVFERKIGVSKHKLTFQVV